MLAPSKAKGYHESSLERQRQKIHKLSKSNNHDKKFVNVT